MKCDKCGRKIENAFYLNGKKYGYSCYRQELALVLKEKEGQKNAEWSIKTMILTDVLRSKNSKNSFIVSILKQYDNYKKMTALQFKTALKTLTEIERFDYQLKGFELGVEGNPKTTYFNRNDKIMEFYFNNPRIGIMNPIKRKNEVLIEMKDSNDEISYFAVTTKDNVARWQNDKFIEFVKISEFF